MAKTTWEVDAARSFIESHPSEISSPSTRPPADVWVGKASGCVRSRKRSVGLKLDNGGVGAVGDPDVRAVKCDPAWIAAGVEFAERCARGRELGDVVAA